MYYSVYPKSRSILWLLINNYYYLFFNTEHKIHTTSYFYVYLHIHYTNTDLLQVRRRYDRLLISGGCWPWTWHFARAGRSDASGGLQDIRDGRVLVRPDVRGEARKWIAGVPGVRGHGVPVREHAGRRRELQRAQGQRQIRRLQRGQYTKTPWNVGRFLGDIDLSIFVFIWRKKTNLSKKKTREGTLRALKIE